MESSLGGTEIAILSITGGAAFAALVWCLALGLTAVVGGWWRLARLYGDSALFAGDVTRFASAQFGWASYSGVLRVGASEMGLFLATMPIFRPFHPPLLIPWSEIKVEPIARRFGSQVQLVFSSVSGARVTLLGRAAARVRPFLPSLAARRERSS